MFASSTSTRSRITVHVLTFLFAALAASSVVFWVLQWPVRTSALLSPVAVAANVEIDRDKVASLLGSEKSLAVGQASTTVARADYKLHGLIASGEIGQQGSHGSALIGVAGETAKPFKVGDMVANDLMLQSVRSRIAVLGPVGKTSGLITLELPPLPTANFGTN